MTLEKCPECESIEEFAVARDGVKNRCWKCGATWVPYAHPTFDPLADFVKEFKTLKAENAKLKEKLDKAEAALEFYGEESNWQSGDYFNMSARRVTMKIEDSSPSGAYNAGMEEISHAGRRARQALAEIGDKK